MTKEPRRTFREAFSHFNEVEIAAAEDRLDRYLRLVLVIFERLRQEPGFPQSIDTLTNEIGRLTLQQERSTPENHETVA
jgi:hypothetical protein